MSDLMLHGVLNCPVSCGDFVSVSQLSNAAKAASVRIKELEGQLSIMTGFYGADLREDGINAKTDRCYMEAMKILEVGK